jgi:hypothetical protein
MNNELPDVSTIRDLLRPRQLYQIFYQQTGDDSDVLTYIAELTIAEAAKLEGRLEEMETADLIQYASIQAIADIDKKCFGELTDILDHEHN